VLSFYLLNTHRFFIIFRLLFNTIDQNGIFFVTVILKNRLFCMGRKDVGKIALVLENAPYFSWLNLCVE